MAAQRKNEDKILKLIREIANLPGNKHCFDCGEKGTTYVNSSIGSFVCTSCSGLLRGLTPPHRVKSISMATFTQDEVEFLKQHGNEECAKTWLGLWDAKRAIKQDHRDFMIDKYERKRYYLEPASPLMSIPSGRQYTANGANNQQNTQQKSNDNLAILKSITLTPPSNVRINKPPHNSHTSHRTNNNNKLNTSTPNESPLFKQCGPKVVNGLRPNTINGNTSTGGSSASSTGSDVNNKFTPDTDFIADFSKADIFNAVNVSHNLNNGNNVVGNNLVGSKNGLVMTTRSDNNNTNNFNHKNHQSNNVNGNNDSKNGQVTNGIMENFADFEHNQIYNAADDPSQNNYRSNYFGNMSTVQNVINANTSSNCAMSTLSSQLNDVHDLSFNHSTNLNNFSHLQSSWASFTNYQAQMPATESNRWSLPMSMSSTSSLSSSNTFNSNSSINSTPSVDKYAALKDLDEQFKEIKILGGNQAPANGNSQAASANPFKAANPFQANPATQQVNNNSWFNNTNGFTSDRNTANTTNGWSNGLVTQFPSYNGNNYSQNIYNANNNFMAPGLTQTATAGKPGTMGLAGYGQLNANNNYGNPFVAGIVNSNNPFL